MVLDYLGNRPLHMSYDIDACDPGDGEWNRVNREGVCMRERERWYDLFLCYSYTHIYIEFIIHTCILSFLVTYLLCHIVIAPSTGTKVRGGLSYREAHFVAEAVAETGRLGSVDMVEINPQLTDQVGVRVRS